MARRAREAAYVLGSLGTAARDRALSEISSALAEEGEAILSANREDVREAEREGRSSAFLRRLGLDEAKLRGIRESLRELSLLPDPLGEAEGWRRPNGLFITRVRVPLGVVGMIYESRPNVTVDAAGIGIKTGNAVILRGGREALRSNRALVAAIRKGLERAGLPPDAVQLVEDPSREGALEMMRLTGYLDVLIPRGGEGLIRTVMENATVPVIETGTGNCHVYVDEGADEEMALRIVMNAKLSNPAVCNAAEKLLCHRALAPSFLPRALSLLEERGVEIRGCPETRAVFPRAHPASEEDWPREYLDLILGVKVVGGVEEAIAHINRYGTRHSEAIVTRSYERALRFARGVDAACVYINASTRFTDGGEFGFGAEIGISTQKLHARGPMGLRELTTWKYVVYGEGQVRE